MFNTSFLNNLIKKPIGVTTKKKIIAIMSGEVIFPNKIPNLNQSKFNGVKILEFNIPKVTKTKETMNDHNLKLSLFIIG